MYQVHLILTVREKVEHCRYCFATQAGAEIKLIYVDALIDIIMLN